MGEMKQRRVKECQEKLTEGKIWKNGRKKKKECETKETKYDKGTLFGKDLVSETLSKTITTPPRRPLFSPFNPPTPIFKPPPLVPSHPSIYPSIHPSIATIPGLLLSHSWSSSGFPSFPTTHLLMCV
ncbi:unnamed protein product [Pleuronectes platessa]|uniref:Uncharacterized protein n=1 Tax=Pleuronectes platessa TaxID=8262 RepID=A0A9N7TTD7_PLEPL|nr:unnamed protein product [Pleuronectes platessa]